MIVPVHNDLARTVRFLDSFRLVDYPNYRLVVVDDGSTDGTASTLAARYPHVLRLAGSGDLWWAGATNRGVREALEHGCDYVLTINNDTRVTADFLRRLVDAAQKHPKTIVGSRIEILGQPGVVWALGSEMVWEKGEIFHLRHRGESLPTSSEEFLPAETLTGCGTLIPAACFREVGYYDATHFPQYHADAEFVLRAARKGWRALIATRAIVYNDVPNSAADKVGNWTGWIFSKRSAVYWRPLLAIHLRYCPHRLRARSLWQYYGWYFWRNDERVRQFGWLLRPLRSWWRKLEAGFDSPQRAAAKTSEGRCQTGSERAVKVQREGHPGQDRAA